MNVKLNQLYFENIDVFEKKNAELNLLTQRVYNSFFI